MTCGIYKITNKTNGKAYIGASTNIEDRWYNHNHHRNQRMYQIMDKYGGNGNFTFEIIEECSVEELRDKERYYIKLYDTKVPKGYNLTGGGEHNSNTTGYYRVSKIKNNKMAVGYLFEYESLSSNIGPLSSKSILDLERRVKMNNLPWKIIDEVKANNTLQENLKDLNNPKNKYPRNKTGYFQVHKEKCDNGFREYNWVYTYKDNGKKVSIHRWDLNELKEEILNRGLEWKIIDKEKAELSDNENKIHIRNHPIRNPTGYYGVKKRKVTKQALSYRFEYKYHDKSIGSCSLRLLEQKVKCKGLKWKIMDEALANETLQKMRKI